MFKPDNKTPFPSVIADEPLPLWARLLKAIDESSDGISRTGLRQVAGHKVPARDIEDALAYLEAREWAYPLMVKPTGKGSPAEWWHLGPKPEGDTTGSKIGEGGIFSPQVAEVGGAGREERISGDGEANFLPPSPSSGTGTEDSERGLVVTRKTEIAELNHPPDAPLSHEAKTEPTDKGEAEAEAMANADAERFL